MLFILFRNTPLSEKSEIIVELLHSCEMFPYNRSDQFFFLSNIPTNCKGMKIHSLFSAVSSTKESFFLIGTIIDVGWGKECNFYPIFITRRKVKSFVNFNIKKFWNNSLFILFRVELFSKKYEIILRCFYKIVKDTNFFSLFRVLELAKEFKL